MKLGFGLFGFHQFYYDIFLYVRLGTWEVLLYDEKG